MSTEANKALVVQLYEEIFNHGNLDLADILVAPEAVVHDPQVPPGAPSGPAGLRFVVTLLRTAFPDDQHLIEDLIAEGDKVVARLTHQGTHQGPLFGLPPTGKRISQTSIHIFRFADGKLVEGWANRDDLDYCNNWGLFHPRDKLPPEQHPIVRSPGNVWPGEDTTATSNENGGVPMHIESSIVIHRPVEAVFAYVSDFRRITEGQGAVKEVHLTSEGPIGLGSQGQGVASFLGVKIENTLEVTAFEPGQRLAIRSISGPFPIEFAYHFASVAEGTQLRFSLQAEPGGVFKLADPLLASQSKKEAEANLQRLKALLEAQQS